jgi:hypothetical protein
VKLYVPWRKGVKRHTASMAVPVRVTGDGEAIAESQAIVAWANAHAAPATVVAGL